MGVYVTFSNSGTSPPPPPPVWQALPPLNFTQGTPGSYNLNTYCRDALGDPLTFTLAVGTLESGVTLSPGGILSYNGSGGAATATGLVFQASNSVASTQSAPASSQIVSSGGPGPPDFYISPNGDDNNAGTAVAPWSITALNTKQSVYAGKRVALLPGTYQYGTVAGVQTSLYSLYQALTSGSCVLQVNGGTAVSSTYIGSYDQLGNYSPRTAIIDASDPSTGNKPTVEGILLGQSHSGTHVPATYGYVQFDGLIVRYFTFSGIGFNTGSVINPVTIQNCEIFGGANVSSANNPGAIFFWTGSSNITVTNCKIHDCQTSSGGFHPWGHVGIMLNGSGAGPPYSSGSVKNCTIYNIAQSVATKIGHPAIQVSYCYLDSGSFGLGSNGYSGALYEWVTAAGQTVNVHHNIIVGYGIQGVSPDPDPNNEGTINYYNNTFYSANPNLDVLWNVSNGATGAVSFYNNIVWSDGSTPAYDAGARNPIGIWVNGPTGIASWDHNAYGANGNGVRFATANTFAAGTFNLPLSTWQGNGYDANSVAMASTPFTGAPAAATPSSFAISVSSPAYTAGVGGAICGALDGSGSVGCNF